MIIPIILLPLTGGAVVQVIEYKFLESPCDSKPCRNGGRCKNKGKNFECICPSNFDGKRCQDKSKNSKLLIG